MLSATLTGQCRLNTGKLKPACPELALTCFQKSRPMREVLADVQFVSDNDLDTD